MTLIGAGSLCVHTGLHTNGGEARVHGLLGVLFDRTVPFLGAVSARAESSVGTNQAVSSRSTIIFLSSSSVELAINSVPLSQVWVLFLGSTVAFIVVLTLLSHQYYRTRCHQSKSMVMMVSDTVVYTVTVLIGNGA
jgi:hypothetical protein